MSLIGRCCNTSFTINTSAASYLNRFISVLVMKREERKRGRREEGKKGRGEEGKRGRGEEGKTCCVLEKRWYLKGWYIGVCREGGT